MSLIDMSEVEYNASCLLTTKPVGDYERWTLEVFRRRYIKEKASVDEAEAAFREACKGGTFTAAEAAAHDKTFRETESQRSITRASLSQLVRMAGGDLKFYRTVDEWNAKDRRYAEYEYEVTYAALPGSAEEERDKALLAAEREMKSALASNSSDMADAIRRSFMERKAAIEEAYYKARV